MIFKSFSSATRLVPFLILLLGSQSSLSKVNFTLIKKEVINLNKLEIHKEEVFSFLNATIKMKRTGLGAYGRVSFNLCQIPIDGQVLEEYKSPSGRELKFLSNPSCAQTVLQKILENDYSYESGTFSIYDNRRCLLTVEKIFSPLMEYYTILFEEKIKKCPGCTQQENNRLAKISSIQVELGEKCLGENGKVLHFLEDLDQTIESAYKEKSGIKR